MEWASTDLPGHIQNERTGLKLLSLETNCNDNCCHLTMCKMCSFSNVIPNKSIVLKIIKAFVSIY